MGLTNPGWALGRSCLLSISLKLLILSGIPSFSTNLFRLASLLALLVGLNLSFLIGALVGFSKSPKSFLSSLLRCSARIRSWPYSFLLMIFHSSLPSSISCSLYADDLAIWSPLRWRPHKELCFDWSADLSTGVFLSIQVNVRPPSSLVDPPQANLQPNLLLLGSHPHFDPLKAKFFPCLKALRCISASSWGPSKESLFLLYKTFLQPLVNYTSPGWFPYLSATNFIKLECLHQAASHAIIGCLSFSPIPLLLSKASLPPLRVTLTHFPLLFYD